MTPSLRWPRLAVMVGFITVASGWIGYTAVVWGFSPGFGGLNRANTIFGVFSVVGYGILAAASWAWFRWMESSRLPLTGMTLVLRLFALGHLLLAAGLGAVGYSLSHQALTQPYDGRTTPVGAASYGLECFGFLLAAIAFWSASSKVGATRSERPLPEERLVPT